MSEYWNGDGEQYGDELLAALEPEGELWRRGGARWSARSQRGPQGGQTRSVRGGQGRPQGGPRKLKRPQGGPQGGQARPLRGPKGGQLRPQRGPKSGPHGRGCGCARCRGAGGHIAGCNCARCRRDRVLVGRFYDGPAPFDMPAPPEAGSEHTRWVQSTLNRALDLRLPVDGVMSAAVRSAVRSFQRREGLPEDGIVGPPTEAALARAAGGGAPADGAEPAPRNGNGGPKGNGNGASPAPDGDQAAAQGGGEEAELPPTPCGGREHTRWVQGALNRAIGARLTVDGLYGPATRSAVRTFQQRSGLSVDGIVGPQTEAALTAAMGGVATPRPAQRCEVLSGFDFDRDVLKPQHQRQLAAVARRLAAGKARGVRIIGHTDPVGAADYNLGLGRRRAERVAAELRRAVDRVKPGTGRSLALRVESRGEREPIPGDAARSRRVEICFGAATKPPREEGSCGVPQRTALGEMALELELDELEGQDLELETPPPTVLARLSLHQNASNTSHRNHFLCGASRQARRLAAIASPTAVACRRRIGATPYDTGADIISAITNAYHCLRQRPVDAIHIFGHSGSNGVYGTTGGRAGLYSAGETGIDRAGGGRTVADVPVAFLAPNVVVVLHGCNQANGTDNFAKSLYDHLAATLSNPRVYGHTNSGCASRNNSWREYSKRFPNGRSISMPAAIYSDVGCCS